VVAVAAVIGFFVLTSRNAPGSAEPSPAANSVVASKVTTVPASVYDAVGKGADTVQSLKVAPAGDLLKSAAGKPVILYVGAEYCPYCASQRWALIAALSRFGTFNGLGLSSSSSKDVFPNTPTFTFRGASYTSDLIEFQAVETSDRDQRPLRNPDPTQQKSMDRFDPDGSIPYLSIADSYYMDGTGYSPDVLSGKSYDDIANALRDPSTTIAKNVIGTADRMTAAICAVTSRQPAAVCTSASVQGLLPTK
jgi:thiol-disulfide isomerase/thioredoxin